VAGAYVAGVFGLVGALLGGLIAGVVSLKVAREATSAAERAWMRDSRRGTYDRFLSSGQRLLIACETLKASRESNAEVEGSLRESVRPAYVEFFEAYGVVQTVAEPLVFRAAREYAYRLQDLKSGLDPTPRPVAQSHFWTVAELVRESRHATIDAMRKDLDLKGPSLRWDDDYNPFTSTDLEGEWKGRPSPRDLYSGGPAGPGGVA
jgi:hypothetical protein